MVLIHQYTDPREVISFTENFRNVKDDHQVRFFSHVRVVLDTITFTINRVLGISNIALNFPIMNPPAASSGVSITL